MQNRRHGFLWEDEREVIDDPNCDDAQVEHRLRTDAVDAQGLGKILQTVRGDFNRIEKFWQRQGRQEWEDLILPANEREIRRLYLLLGHWLEIAETDFVKQEREAIEEVTEPLQIDEREETIARWDAVLELTRNDELRPIFAWITDNPKSKIPSREDYTYGDIPWRQAASSLLRNKHGLIEQHGTWKNCYTLSDRGKVVSQTLENITESDKVEESDIIRWWSR